MPLKLRKYCRTMEATGDDLVNVVKEKEEISEDLSVAEPLIPYTDSDSDEEYPDLEERFERLDQINNKVQNESLSPSTTEITYSNQMPETNQPRSFSSNTGRVMPQDIYDSPYINPSIEVKKVAESHVILDSDSDDEPALENQEVKLANTPALKPPYTFNLFSFDIPLVYERARFRLGCPIGDQSTKERYLDTDTINYFANYVRAKWSKEDNDGSYVMALDLWSQLVPESTLPGNALQINYTRKSPNEQIVIYDKIKPLIWGTNGRKRKHQDLNMEKLDLFEKEIIFFPICEERHWSLAIVANPKKAFDMITKTYLKGLEKPPSPEQGTESDEMTNGDSHDPIHEDISEDNEEMEIDHSFDPPVENVESDQSKSDLVKIESPKSEESEIKIPPLVNNETGIKDKTELIGKLGIKDESEIIPVELDLPEKSDILEEASLEIHVDQILSEPVIDPPGPPQNGDEIDDDLFFEPPSPRPESGGASHMSSEYIRVKPVPVPDEDEPVIYVLCSLRKPNYPDKCRVINALLSYILLDEKNASTQKYRDELKTRGVIEEDGTCLWDTEKVLLPFKYGIPQVPHQVNDYDCGMFVLYFLENWFSTSRPKMTEDPAQLEKWFEPRAIFDKRYEFRRHLDKMADSKQPGKFLDREPENDDGDPKLLGYMDTLAESLRFNEMKKNKNHFGRALPNTSDEESFYSDESDEFEGLSDEFDECNDPYPPQIQPSAALTKIPESPEKPAKTNGVLKIETPPVAPRQTRLQINEKQRIDKERAKEKRDQEKHDKMMALELYSNLNPRSRRSLQTKSPAPEQPKAKRRKTVSSTAPITKVNSLVLEPDLNLNQIYENLDNYCGFLTRIRRNLEIRKVMDL